VDFSAGYWGVWISIALVTFLYFFERSFNFKNTPSEFFFKIVLILKLFFGGEKNRGLSEFSIVYLGYYATIPT
jgi:hypothetical protein